MIMEERYRRATMSDANKKNSCDESGSSEIDSSMRGKKAKEELNLLIDCN